MIDYLKKQSFIALKIIVVLTPCLLSMYLLYWLGKTEAWVPETSHRDKITIVILVVGMAMSFFIQSYFTKQKKK